MIRIISKNVSMAKIIIEDFMTSELGLSGNQLVLYAHLWAESKQGIIDITNNYSRYAAAMNVTMPTYYSTLKALEMRGLIRKLLGAKLQINRNAKI